MIKPTRAFGTIVAALVLAACTGTGTASPPSGTQQTGASPGPTTALTVGLGYIPSVQFAPFYLAQQNGYYAEAGLQVTFQNKIDPDLVALVGQGAIDIGVADGTSVIPAVSQGIPIKYVATIYGQYPSIVFAKALSGIDTPQELRGKKVGIPGKYGSSWIMLQAMLEAAGMTPDDVTVVEYPDFGQGTALQAGAVDAATGFVNNEPVVLEHAGIDVFVMRIDRLIALPGPGLTAGAATIDAKRDALARFIAATLRSMDEIAADPDKGLDAAIAAVPELAADRPLQGDILAATIDAWGTGGRFGDINRTGWEDSIAYTQKLGLVPHAVTFDDLVLDDLLPAR